MINKDQIEELYSLNPSGMIELFQLDLGNILNEDVSLGDEEYFIGGIFYFYSGNNFKYEMITWKGIKFAPLPAEGVEFGMDTRKPPRPKIRIANIEGLFSQMLQSISLEGAILTRYMVPIKYLPDVNFKGGNPWDEEGQEELFEPSVFYVERKTSESPQSIEYELSIPMDMEGAMLPSVQVMGSICPFQYRGAGCNYDGAHLTDKNNKSLIHINHFAIDYTLYHNNYFSSGDNVYWYIWQADPARQSIHITSPNFNSILETYADRFRLIVEGDFEEWSEGRLLRDPLELNLTEEPYQAGDMVKVTLPGMPPFIQVCRKTHMPKKPEASFANMNLWHRDYCNKTPEACFNRFGYATPYGGMMGTSFLPFK